MSQWLVTADEMRALDERTIREAGVPGVVLMESAGRAVADLVAECAAPIAGRRVAVVCGGGNNGGDGFVAARHLCNRGALVKVILVADAARIEGDARVHFEAMRRMGVTAVDGGEAGYSAAATLLDGADIIVDAILGTGAARPITGHLGDVIDRMNASKAMRVAVDLPTGLDVDRGVPLGSCVRAHHTVTFAFAKVGLVCATALEFVGALHVADIGIPERFAVERSVACRLLGDDCLAPARAPRPSSSHKGTFGHVLVVAGSAAHPGAALITAEAAARAGAGLVTIATFDETARALAARVLEVSLAPLGTEPRTRADGAARCAALEAILDGKTVVAFGPGVPPTPGTRALLERLLAVWKGPLVIDADGLNLLAEDTTPLAATGAQVVLTPHPKEMARLAQISTTVVQADRLRAARTFAATHGVVVILKGARTVIAAPDGQAAINPTGNPGLASGGTGDALTGIVAALLANGLGPFEAAQAGAYLHGRAGDLARDEIGEAGLLASDLIARLPAARRG